MSVRQTRQLDAWRGDFGNSYIDRNAQSAAGVSERARMWARVFERLPQGAPTSILEVGCNIGLNLRALPSV